MLRRFFTNERATQHFSDSTNTDRPSLGRSGEDRLHNAGAGETGVQLLTVFEVKKGDSGLHIQFGSQVITRCKMVPANGGQMEVILRHCETEERSSMAGLFEVKGDWDEFVEW